MNVSPLNNQCVCRLVTLLMLLATSVIAQAQSNAIQSNAIQSNDLQLSDIKSTTGAVTSNSNIKTKRVPRDSARLIAFKNSLVVGTLENSSLKEVSGIAASHINKDMLWVLNDSGNEAAIFAIGQEGQDLGEITLFGASNQDWEDLASFTLNNQSYLVVGDIGDNFALRNSSVLYVVKEPKLVGERYTENLVISPVSKITFKFEDGARDCKALAVDVQANKIYLLSKSDVPPTIYELPLSLSAQENNVYIARKSASLERLPRTSLSEVVSSFGQRYFSNQPTAMDISKDGSGAIVLTQDHLFYYRKKEGQDWHTTFRTQIPMGIPIDELREAEAASFSIDGQSLFVTTESRPAPLIRIDRVQ